MNQNYLHHQHERGPPWVETVHRIILPFASQRLWSQQGWHARNRTWQGENSQWHCSVVSQSLHRTQPSKKCHPLWSLQHSPNPLPFDHYSSNTQQSFQALISDILSSLSVPPSISMIICLSFSEKKNNLCLHFQLTWRPVPHCADQWQPQSRPSEASAECWLCGIWSVATQLRVTKRGILTKCHLSV